MLYIVFSPQLYVLQPSHCLWLGLEEDVVEPNMEATIKSRYGQFEVWSL